MAPGIRSKDQPYLCTHNIIRAHAAAYHLYDKVYRPIQGGVIGITLDAMYMYPSDPNNPSDVDAAERAEQFNVGWFASPLYFGKYPDVMTKYVGEASARDGLEKSRLPTFTREESVYIQGILLLTVQMHFNFTMTYHL